jgi:hypothetical protein
VTGAISSATAWPQPLTSARTNLATSARFEARSAIRRDGYISFPSFFCNEECDAQQGALQELTAARATKSVVPHPLFEELVGDERLIQLARTILGDEPLFHHANGRVLPENFPSKPWHHDHDGERSTWGTGMVHFMCYPAGISAGKGPLIVLPGSHERVVARSHPSRHGDARLPGDVEITGGPGLLVAMDSALWHMRPAPAVLGVRSYFNISYCRRGVVRPERRSLQPMLRGLSGRLGPHTESLLAEDT